jgi:hypothetical protein
MKNKILNPFSDYPFTKEDIIDEFSVYQELYEIYWFDYVSKLNIYNYYAVELLQSDIAVIGFKIKENEFYIGTFESVWYLISNKQKYMYSFENIHNSSILNSFNILNNEFQIPVEMIYSFIRLAKKYEAE